VFSDADAAALYDLLNPWDPGMSPSDAFYDSHALRVWHEVESVIGDVVTFAETTAQPDGTVLREDRSRLRFLDPVTTLDACLGEADSRLSPATVTGIADPLPTRAGRSSRSPAPAAEIGCQRLHAY
jgi:hypothetical protein